MKAERIVEERIIVRRRWGGEVDGGEEKVGSDGPLYVQSTVCG